ncbi:hypothetical protein CLV92_1303 [Kineococcus xinjiangensis]|uniref:Uncharacterized protein n=1 Tax=Kineococcus xinjiangensis TaxID=512762 RepID=A0A2S6IBV1_9ACTN|nr:hypothetical protein [Kineococcus xinjiangensis]PPK89814.1 hypothetical protein CLV92_1303 [Kineococcus xinjiangensis]
MNGACSSEQVGLFLAQLLPDQDDTAAEPSAQEAIDATLTMEQLIAAGGLRVEEEGTGAVVVPGCCAGLENWREWAEVLRGQSPWLGHDPTPAVEVLPDRLRIWQDSEAPGGAVRVAAGFIDLQAVALPGLLREVQADLIAFLERVERWGQQHELGDRGTALVQMLDAHFHISAPLDLPEA